MAASSHPGRTGGERSSRAQNDRERRSGNDGRGRDRSQHPGRVGGEQAARASSEAAARRDTRPGGDHPGRVGGEQAQAASSVGARNVDHFKDARNALGSRIRDEADLGNTATENAANTVADFFGVHELEPEFDLENLNPNADWGFDVLGAVAGLAGSALNFPLLGTIVSQGEELLGIRDDLSINLGTLNSPDEDLLGEDDDFAINAGDGTAATDAIAGARGGTGNGIDAGVDEIYGDLVPKPPKPKPKPPKPYSNVQLGDVVSVLDMLGLG